MAIVIGNLALLLDVTSPRTIVPHRKTRPVSLDVLLNLTKKETLPITNSANSYSYWTGKSFESDVEGRKQRVVARGKENSNVNGVDYDSDEEYGDGNEDDEEEEVMLGWEKEMRMRIREVEEMRELERKAEELQSRVEKSEGEGGGEETEEEKKMRVKKELEKVAKERAERRATAQLMFDLGQKAYGRGKYRRAVEFLEAALTIIPRPTLFGGEIQIWLAMAYEANNRHDDCIELYLELEKKHPYVSIQRQAAELRYIAEAPRLKISKEETASIFPPSRWNSYDSYAVYWSDKSKDKDWKGNWSSDVIGDFLKWRPPTGLDQNRVFWVALTLWFGLVGAALILQK